MKASNNHYIQELTAIVDSALEQNPKPELVYITGMKFTTVHNRDESAVIIFNMTWAYESPITDDIDDLACNWSHQVYLHILEQLYTVEELEGITPIYQGNNKGYFPNDAEHIIFVAQPGITTCSVHVNDTSLQIITTFSGQW